MSECTITLNCIREILKRVLKVFNLAILVVFEVVAKGRELVSQIQMTTFHIGYVFTLMLFCASARSQSVGINDTGASPDSSAILDVSSTTKGFLPPRMTTAERDAIVSPADGLLIFNTTTGCLNFSNNTNWHTLCGVIGPGTIASLDCSGAIHNGLLTSGVAAVNVNSVLSYTGGNGGSFNGQTVNSTGVTGLSALLTAGNFSNGSGSLTFTITGTPGGSGVASFTLNIGGQSCTLTRTVIAPGLPNSCNPSNPTAIVEVLNPITGKTWMDRNLGANRASISSTDAESYGFLYQWGRGSDGHQCVNRYPGDGVTTSITTTVLSSSDNPGHGDYITTSSSPNDWRTPENTSLWQGVNGTNNPCPNGFRVPTQTELNAERASWGSNDAAGAFSSPLKLPMAGNREHNTGNITGVGTAGRYTSSTINGIYSIRFWFNSTDAGTNVEWRARAFSVRCIKE
jgi:uncharacterized protein (TIGR02145 family)